MRILWSAAWLGLLAAALPWAAPAAAQEAVSLREAFAPGSQYHVSSRVDLTGSLTLPPEKDRPARALPVTGSSAVEYDEKVLSLTAEGEVQKTARIYRRMDFQRKIGDRPQQNTLRPPVRRLIVLRHKNAEVPFSPDGPLVWGEIDLVRTDVFTPSLVGLLPAGAVRVGERWTAAGPAVQELTDLERVEDGRVECRLEEFTTFEQRRHARVSFAGVVRGVNEDGPNRQQLEGYYFFDLESNHLSYLYLKGVSLLLDKDGREMGRVEGRFVLARQTGQRCKDLTDEALKGVALEPDADNTQLLYDNAELGVRFLYPRRWHVAGVRGRQVAVDEPNGNGLLLTVEPLAQVPAAGQFLSESRDYLLRQKARVLRVDPPQRLQAAPRELDHFVLEAELSGTRMVMDYFVLRQQAGGATLAARLLPADAAAVHKEVERIARSVVISAGYGVRGEVPAKK